VRAAVLALALLHASIVTISTQFHCGGRYDDEKKLAQLMRKLDTNGDGVVRLSRALSFACLLTVCPVLPQVDRDELVVFILRKAHDASDGDYAEGMRHLKAFALNMKVSESQGTSV